jgi:hypothetical protein
MFYSLNSCLIIARVSSHLLESGIKMYSVLCQIHREISSGQLYDSKQKKLKNQHKYSAARNLAHYPLVNQNSHTVNHFPICLPCVGIAKAFYALEYVKGRSYLAQRVSYIIHLHPVAHCYFTSTFLFRLLCFLLMFFLKHF